MKLRILAHHIDASLSVVTPDIFSGKIPSMVENDPLTFCIRETLNLNHESDFVSVGCDNVVIVPEDRKRFDRLKKEGVKGHHLRFEIPDRKSQSALAQYDILATMRPPKRPNEEEVKRLAYAIFENVEIEIVGLEVLKVEKPVEEDSESSTDTPDVSMGLTESPGGIYV